MGTLGDKIAGKTKQVIAEVIGDGKLDREGRAQQMPADVKRETEKSEVGPIENIRNLS